MPSLRFELHIELDSGEEYDVVSDQRDIARWEVQDFGWPIVKIEDQASMQFFRFIGWSAALRQGLTTLPWSKFDEVLVEAMPVDDEEDGQGAPDDADDPGRPAPSASRSSRSRAKAAKR